MKQKDAVYAAVFEVMGKKDGVAYQPTTEQRKTIIEIVTQGILSGEVDMKEEAREKYDSEESLRKGYVNGLVSNWLRKGKELNGGVAYQAANPGSRAHSQDEEVKTLRTLIKSGQFSDDKLAKIQAKLDERVAQLKAEKAKSTINLESIDPELLAELGLDE